MRNAAVVVSVSGLVGCASEGSADGPDGVRQRQDAALRDPFSYGPDMPTGKTATPAPAIKPTDDSAKGAWDRFWNP